jgi:Spy/CpxP family protein refolding chaperone
MKTLHWTTLALVTLAGIAASGCAAEPRGPSASVAPMIEPHEPAVPGRVERRLFPPQLVIQHQRALALDEAQIEALTEDMRSSQQDLTPLTWRLGRAEEALATVLREPRVDEEAAVAAAREVATIEGELKIARLRLMVRMKSRLSETQQAQLEQLR